MVNGLSLYSAFLLLLTTQRALHWTHIPIFKSRHIHTEFGKQRGVQCLAQGHINM